MLKQTKLCRVSVCLLEHVQNVDIESFDGVILSPGPGLPSEKKGLFGFIKKIETHKPILGVCLGHQAIAEYYGARIVQLNKILHGEASVVNVLKPHKLFNNLGKQVTVGRYHSWIVDGQSLPECFEVVSETQNGTIMALSHRHKNICTVQFHPESILTPKGKQLLENWLVYCIGKL